MDDRATVIGWTFNANGDMMGTVEAITIEMDRERRGRLCLLVLLLSAEVVEGYERDDVCSADSEQVVELRKLHCYRTLIVETLFSRFPVMHHAGVGRPFLSPRPCTAGGMCTRISSRSLESL